MANNFNPYQQPVYPTYNPYTQQPMYPPQIYQQQIQQPVQQPQQTDIFSQILERLDRIEKALSTRPQKNYRKEGENNV